jgi:tRNA-2-methylthio-N6-dimethylallyladenosine synthase
MTSPVISSEKALKKLYIKTYGCQMNVYDSERMADILKPHGYELTDNPDASDMIIMNTCHIREKATEKVYCELGRYKPIKKDREQEGKPFLLAVAGCVGQAEGGEIMKRAPYVDIVLGPQSYHQLPEMIERAKRAFQEKQQNLDDKKKLKAIKRDPIVYADFPVESKFDHLPQVSDSKRFSAFLTIQEGCDKFCTFCCVPYTRGAEYSRPVLDIVKEAKHYVAAGAQEITLLGQNVNAYHGLSSTGSGEWGLAALCLELANIDGLKRIRYTTSHPKDMDDALIRAHGDCDKLMPFLHLPVQSGSDRVLKAMNRKHTAAFYEDIIQRLRAANADIGFSSDFIVGFPGETDEDFEQTMGLVERVGYGQAYSFSYSPRLGTPAAALETQVPEDVKKERLHRLQSLLFSQQLAYNKSFVGRTIPVLFERHGKKAGQFLGKSPHMQSVHVMSNDDMMGKIRWVKITEAFETSLQGDIINEPT